MLPEALSVNLNYMWEQGERAQCMSVLNTVVKTMLFLFLVGSFFILLLKDFLIGTLYGVEYLPGASIIYILLMMQVFRVIRYFMGIYPSLIEKTWVGFVVGAPGFIANIGLNYWLIPLYQMKGAAIASATSFFLILALLLIFNKHLGYKIDIRIFGLVAVSLLILIDHVWIFGAVLGLLCIVALKTDLLLSDSEKEFIFEKLKEGFGW